MIRVTIIHAFENFAEQLIQKEYLERACLCQNCVFTKVLSGIDDPFGRLDRDREYGGSSKALEKVIELLQSKLRFESKN